MTDTEEAASGASEEFEREPVPKRALLGFRSFIGMYAGEHTAGTELMIGPLFVARGASAAAAEVPRKRRRENVMIRSGMGGMDVGTGDGRCQLDLDVAVVPSGWRLSGSGRV